MPQPSLERRVDSNGIERVYLVVEGLSCTLNGLEIWKTSATTGAISGLSFSGPVLAADGSAAAPSIAFASEPGTGFWRAASGTIAMVASSANRGGFSSVSAGGRVFVTSTGTSSDAGFYIADTSTLSTTYTALVADGGANLLAMRNGTNAQSFRIYNTFTDTGNYERGVAAWAGNEFNVGTQIAGTGVARPMLLLTGGVQRWQIGATGHLTAVADNTYDIGASGATRPRTGYFGTNVFVGSTGAFLFGSLGGVKGSGTDGVITLVDNSQTNFGRLQFGGTTSSFPALKRSGTSLLSRLADDSDYAPLLGSFLDGRAGYKLAGTLVASVTAPTIASGFGTSPSIVASNGTAAFTINVGTGGVATSGVLTMPAATTGWAITVHNVSTNTATVFVTKQTAFTTTSVTIGNYDAAGASAAWASGDVLVCSAMAF